MYTVIMWQREAYWRMHGGLYAWEKLVASEQGNTQAKTRIVVESPVVPLPSPGAGRFGRREPNKQNDQRQRLYFSYKVAGGSSAISRMRGKGFITGGGGKTVSLGCTGVAQNDAFSAHGMRAK